jgi:hypothetical protein
MLWQGGSTTARCSTASGHEASARPSLEQADPATAADRRSASIGATHALLLPVGEHSGTVALRRRKRSLVASWSKFSCFLAMPLCKRPSVTWVQSRIWCTRRTMGSN